MIAWRLPSGCERKSEERCEQASEQGRERQTERNAIWLQCASGLRCLVARTPIWEGLRLLERRNKLGGSPLRPAWRGVCTSRTRIIEGVLESRQGEVGRGEAGRGRAGQGSMADRWAANFSLAGNLFSAAERPKAERVPASLAVLDASFGRPFGDPEPPGARA